VFFNGCGPTRHGGLGFEEAFHAEKGRRESNLRGGEALKLHYFSARLADVFGEDGVR